MLGSAGNTLHWLGVPPPSPGAARRIWEIESDAVCVALGVLLERCDLERMFRRVDRRDRSGCREDVLLREAVERCGVAGPFARMAERTLDGRTRGLRRSVDGCPLSELAGTWLGRRERVAGRELAALLWVLARDRRWLIRGLFERIRGDLWVRALRLLGEAARPR